MTEHVSKPVAPDALTADYYNSLGLFHASQQKHREATWAFQKALDLDDRCAAAFYNQALSLTALGRLDEAIDSYTNALRVRPDFVDAHFNLANVWQKKGFIEKAIENYWLSVKFKPDFPEAYNNLGLCLKALKRFEKAIACYEKAIELKADYAEAYNNLGLTLQDQGLWAQAIAKFEAAIALKPDQSDVHYNLGFALNEVGKLDAAASHYWRSIQLKPDFVDAHNNLGAILNRQGRIEEAVVRYRTALQYSPGKAEIYNNLGNALKKSGRMDEALEMYQRALTTRPDYAEACNNMGVALQFRGNYKGALSCYEKALKLKPEFAEVRFNRATIDLLHGNFSRGWQGYEWRFYKRHWKDVYPLRHNRPRWDGSPFPQKRLLVYGEQGFGDTIQFVRYLPQVKALGGQVIFETRKPLLACLQGADGIDEVIDRNTVGNPAKGCDLVVPLLSLPGIFGTNLESIPAKIPYLQADAAKLSYWRKRLWGSGFKVGLVWAGNPDQENDHLRSIPLNHLMSLAEIPGLRLFGFQKGSAAAQVREIPADTGLIDLGPELEDFSDTAAAMANMDLIISVCTAAAHLAGALGLPVWTLIGYAPDWRWLLDRDDSPWYPTMRLYRQPKHDDWQGVIRQVKSELKKMVQTRGSGREIIPNTDFETATRHYMAGRHSQALALFHRILQVDPKHYPTLHMLGVAAYQKGDFESAKTLIGRVLSIDSQTALYYLDFGLACAALGESQNAIEAYQRAINLKPDYPEAYNNLGSALKVRGDLSGAIHCYEKAVRLEGNFAEAYNNLGNALTDDGQSEAAIENYRQAISIKPNYGVAHYNLANGYRKMGRTDEAIESYLRAVRCQPDLTEAYIGLGHLQLDQGQITKAVDSFQNAVRIQPDLVNAWNGLGAACMAQGQADQAIENFGRALKVMPESAETYCNLAHAFLNLEQFEDAAVCCNKALDIKPDLAGAYGTLGEIFYQKGQFSQAIEYYQKIIAIRSDDAIAYNNMGNAYKNQGKLEQALGCYQKALVLLPDFFEAHNNIIALFQLTCNWQAFRSHSAQLDALNESAQKKGFRIPEDPLINLARQADPASNYVVAQSWARDIARRSRNFNCSFSFNSRQQPSSKITIGYLSNTFCDHPVAQQISGLFKIHNRGAFNIFCYSYGPDDGSVYRKGIEQDCDKFVDLSTMKHAAGASHIYNDRVDILVDLVGFTNRNRLIIPALRPAPVQVSYLGFLGTTGADFFDYIITDKIVTPQNHSAYYSEKFIYMPHCYQINDNTRRITANNWTRSDFGLPPDGFVFCSFNNSYKFESVMFDTWMKIMRQVPGSVLWLSPVNAVAKKNLKYEAQKQGVDPQRLIFADRVPISEHLARLKFADLALDTRIYNGGATTSNALWASVPVVTLLGSHFVSRMAASALAAVGLREMVTHSLGEYQTLAVQLALNPDRLRTLRQKLDGLRLNTSLFDTPRFVKNLEKAYKSIWQVYLNGKTPRPIEVVDDPQ